MNFSKYVRKLRNPYNGLPLTINEEESELRDQQGNIFPVVNGIPRFVDIDNYANSFGFQWNLFDKTQIDGFSKSSISEERVYKNTRWLQEQLKGKDLLEVGSGAGRFTNVLVKTGANLFSIDYSNAVEANWRTNCKEGDFFLAQASVYDMPFAKDTFDYVFCLGVIQHTPDVEKSFEAMLSHLKPGGQIAIDVYAKNFRTKFYTKYWVRPVTKRMKKDRLLKIIKWYVPLWFPLSTAFLKVPMIGKFLAQIIPVTNYSQQFPELSRTQLVEWAILDTFDMLSPEYDNPQSLDTLYSWVDKYNLNKIYCGKGDNGYVLVAQKK